MQKNRPASRLSTIGEGQDVMGKLISALWDAFHRDGGGGPAQGRFHAAPNFSERAKSAAGCTTCVLQL